MGAAIARAAAALAETPDVEAPSRYGAVAHNARKVVLRALRHYDNHQWEVLGDLLEAVRGLESAVDRLAKRLYPLFPHHRRRLRKLQALMLPKYTATVGRWIFALWYLITGGSWLLAHALGRGSAHQETAAGAIAFQRALSESHFMDPLLAIACLFGGGALLIRRTAPLGIAMLAPIVVVIFLFHLVLTGNCMWGALNLVWFTALAWYYKKAFTALWTYSESL